MAQVLSWFSILAQVGQEQAQDTTPVRNWSENPTSAPGYGGTPVRSSCGVGTQISGAATPFSCKAAVPEPGESSERQRAPHTSCSETLLRCSHGSGQLPAVIPSLPAGRWRTATGEKVLNGCLIYYLHYFTEAAALGIALWGMFVFTL